MATRRSLPGLLRAMVRKDLLRRLRSPLGTLITLSFPLLFSGLLALAFGGSEPRVPKVHLLIEDRDGAFMGGFLKSSFTSEQAAEYFEVELVGAEGRERMEAGEASALLRLPEGLTEDLLEGRPVTLELVRNPAQSILPEIAEQVATILTEGLSAASYLLEEPLREIRPYLEDSDGSVSLPEAAVVASAVSSYRVVDRAAEYLFPPVITLETVTAGEKETGEVEEGPGGSETANVFLFILSGVSVFALFTLGDQMMRDVLTEAQAGTLRRQLLSPVTPGLLVAAKAVLTAVVALVSLVILASIAWLVADHPVSLAGFAVLAVALVVAVTGAAALIYGFAVNERQGATIASVVYLVMAFAGGSFIPLSSLPGVLRAVAPYSLFYWGGEGFREILEGGGLAAALPYAGVLAAAGVALLAAGSWLLGRRVRRGALA